MALFNLKSCHGYYLIIRKSLKRSGKYQRLVNLIINEHNIERFGVKHFSFKRWIILNVVNFVLLTTDINSSLV